MRAVVPDEIDVLSRPDEAHDRLTFFRRVGVEELLFGDSSTKALEVRGADLAVEAV